MKFNSLHRSVSPLAACAAGIVLSAVSANAATAFFTDTNGYGTMSISDAQQWGGSDRTQSSVILELNFDWTQSAIDALTTGGTPPDALYLWEAGGTTSGSNVVIGATNIYQRTASSSSFDLIAAHGLTAATTGVQVVSVIDFANNLVSLYVNGALIASNSSFTASDWAGNNPSLLGQANVEGGGRVSGISSQANYPQTGANMLFRAYLLDDGVNTGDVYSVGAIIIPEPTAALLGGIGMLTLLRRRR